MVSEKNLPRARAEADQVRAAFRDREVDAGVGIGPDDDGTPAVRPHSPAAAKAAADVLEKLGMRGDLVDPGDTQHRKQ